MVYFFKTLVFLLCFSVIVKAGGPPKEEILDALSRSGYAKVAREDIQDIKGAGSNTESVCRILVKQEDREEKKTLICKELKGRKNERENLEAIKPFIKEYEKFRKSQLFQFPPQYVSIAKYRGNLIGKNKEFVLFDEASGQSVFDLMTEWAQKGYSWAGLDPSESKRKLSYAFSNVGRAIASFHLKYGTFHEETSAFYSIIHGDLHTSNILYNLWSNQTTFIDFETMAVSYKIKKDIFVDINRLFDFSKKETAIHVQEKAGEEFVKSRGIYFLDEQMRGQQISYINERLAILDDFFNALKMGYTKAFADAGYICDIDKAKVNSH